MTLAPDRAVRERLRAACDAVNAELARRRRWLLRGAVAGAVVIGITALARPMLVPHALILSLGALGATAAWIRRTAGREHKMGLATMIVPLLRPGLSFHPAGSIGLDEFNALRLFTQRADRVVAQDELRGERNGVSYAVEELRATYTTTSGSGKHRRRTTHTIFRGAAVKLEFNKHFHGHTVVVPRHFGAGLFAGLRMDGMETVTLENAAFERTFLTRSTDDQEARYLLTPRFMEIVLAAQEKVEHDLRLAFRDGTLHVLLNGTKNRFEVPLFGGVTPLQTVTELDEVITLAEDLIETFDLATRIWTKV